jgi:hypothetical protein
LNSLTHDLKASILQPFDYCALAQLDHRASSFYHYTLSFLASFRIILVYSKAKQNVKYINN